MNGDGRPDLYVANDLDPNRLYLNVPGGPLGFHFVEEGRQWQVADRNAGMGVAAQDWSGDGRPDLLATNSRDQGHSASRSTRRRDVHERRRSIARAIGTSGTGWGDSWVDLANDGRLDLVLANGAIPVTQPEEGRRADPGAREHGRRPLRGRDRRPRAEVGAARERARAGGGRLRQRRPRWTSRSTRSAAS